MQTIIGDLMKNLSDEGMNREDMIVFLKGLFAGMILLQDQLILNKIKPIDETNDPMFPHNWNYIIDRLSDSINSTIQDTLESVPDGIGDKDDFIAERDTEHIEVD